MRKTKKTKALRVQEAVDALNKAMQLEEPNIRINLPGGMDEKSQESQEFILAIKSFIQAYKKFYGLKEIGVEFTL